MDTTQPSFSAASAFSIAPADLFAQQHGAAAPLVIDVRQQDAFLASPDLLPGALRRDPLRVEQWVASLPHAGSVLVYCAQGHDVGFNTMAVLRAHGIPAHYLQGGLEQWRSEGLPLAVKPVGSGTRWVTRERPKIDRIACPWLIRRFVDADAEFLYVPTAQVSAVAQRERATAYDVAPQVASTRFTHEGDQCSFDAFIRHYQLRHAVALLKLAEIVRAADTDRLELAPQAAGLLAVSLGMSRTHTDDHAMLDVMMPVYDALYAWCLDAVAGQDEKHNWRPQGTAR